MVNKEIVTCIGFDGKEYKVAKSDLIQRTSIYGVIVEGDRALLSKQTNGYDLPGGGKNTDETDEQCVIREVKEETGVNVKVISQIGEEREGYFKRTQGDGVCIHSTMRYYLCKKTGGEISTDGFDDNEKSYVLPAEWVMVENLSDIVVAASFDWRELVEKTNQEND